MKLVEKPKGRIVLYFACLQVPQWPIWSPLCQYALATALMHAGYEVVFIDERVDPDPQGWLEKELPGALFVGVPGKSGDQCRNMEKTARFVKLRRPDLPVVVGGWFPSLFPEQTITSDYIDVVVIGPADFILPELADRLREGRRLDGLPSTYFKADGRIVKNPLDRLPPLEKTLPVPWHVVGIARYMHPHRWLNYFTSRGCPGGCRFCSVYCLSPHRWTALPPERVIADMEVLVREIGAEALKILDTDFCADRGRVERICQLILERGLKLRFHCLGRYHSLSRFTDEQLHLLRRAGCEEIEVGLETGSQRLADRLRKAVDVDAFAAMAARFVGAGIRLRVNVMLGLPTETRAEFARTFQKMLELEALGDGIRFQLFLFTPLPGTELGEEVWAMPSRAGRRRAPSTYRELLDFEVNNALLDMFWLARGHERAAKRAYYFYGPLVFHKNALDAARGRPWWRFVLRCLRPLAAWRLRHGRLGLPFEQWLNGLFGRPLSIGADSGITPPDDRLPAPEIGQAAPTPRPPLPALVSRRSTG